MKYAYITLAILSAVSLTACKGGVSSSDHHNATQDNNDVASTVDKNDLPKVELKPKKELPAPELVDALRLDRNDADDLQKRLKAEGNGSVVIHWDNKFKAMSNINANLPSKKPERKVNEDGTRYYLNASWDEISITEPNTIIGHSGANLSHTSGPKVIETVTLDLKKAQQEEQELIIRLDNEQEVKVKYQADVLNLGEENGAYVAQSVHVFGKELPQAESEKPLEMAYIYGVVSPDSFNGIKDLPTQATYEGIATYLKHGETDIKKGTSSFDVAFDNHEVTVTNGKIKIPDADIDIFVDEFLSDLDGKKNPKKSTTIMTRDFNNTGKFRKSYSNQIRGRFYGEKAQYLGGVFYDNNGAGTFFSGDKERGGEVSAE